MKLLVLILKGVLCVVVSLCSLCIPSGFGGRAECEMNTGHTSLGVLTATTLVGGRVEYGEARDRDICELGLLLCLMVSPPYWDMGLRSMALE